jgi:hypothetical protein
MSTATYAQFVAAIQALTVAGVVRKHTEPPMRFNYADLPCSFVMFPSGDNAPLAFQGAREFRPRAADFVVVHAETAPTADAPFVATVAMMDAVEDALLTLDVGQSELTWTIRSQVYLETAERWYWAVVATIQGTG